MNVSTPYFGPQCFQCIKTIPYYWTSMPPMHQNYSIFWTSMPPMHQNYSILLDLYASNASELFHILDLNVHFDSPTAYNWPSMSISGSPTAYYWTSMSILNSRNSLRGVGVRPGARGGTAAAAMATVPQELWTSGRALVQRAQEPNIPCGESLTST